MEQVFLMEEDSFRDMQATSILQKHGLLGAVSSFQNRHKQHLSERIDYENGVQKDCSGRFKYWFPVYVSYNWERIKAAKLECMNARCYSTCQLLRAIELYRK